MSQKGKTEHPVEVHPEYLAELRHRIETGPGIGVLAAAAGMNRGSLWRILNQGRDQRITVDAVERARRGLAYLQEGIAPMPPPVVSVRGPVHHDWIQVGEVLLDEDAEMVARVVAHPERLRAAIQELAATLPPKR